MSDDPAQSGKFLSFRGRIYEYFVMRLMENIMKAVAKGIVSILLLPLAMGAQAVLAEEGSSNIYPDPVVQEQGAMVEAAAAMENEQDTVQYSEMTREEQKQYKADMKAEKKAAREQLRAEKKAAREQSRAEKKAEREQLKAEREKLKAEKKAAREQRKAERKAERDRRREEREQKRAMREQDPKYRRPLDERFEDF